MRSIATLHLAMTGDPSLRSSNVPSVADLMEGTFALAAGLSKAIEIQRLKAVDTRLVPPSEAQGSLINKEDLAILEKSSKVDKALKGGHWNSGKKGGKGFKGYGARFQPYYSSHSHGRGKGKGYKGKGAPKFAFKAEPKGDH